MISTPQEFWANRAKLGPEAGTQDLIAKQLEIEFLCFFIADGMRILDAGCGNGVTVLEMARRAKVAVTGVDKFPAMVEAAILARQNALIRGNAEFLVADVLDLPPSLGEFDLVFTERTLINLPDWAAQTRAIRSLARRVRAGGRYVMVENSLDAVERLNRLRISLGLPEIVPPWHNRYLREDEIANLEVAGLRLAEVRQYSSTYYFLSRVVNAALASGMGGKPDYQSPINKLALRLPGDLCDGFGQGVAWIWEAE